MLMKIAIPSDNGLFLCPKVSQATGFLVVSVELGEIVSQQWIPVTGNHSGEPFSRWSKALEGCETLLLERSDEVNPETLRQPGIRVIRTGETIITRAILEYLETSLSRETNQCCCP